MYIICTFFCYCGLFFPSLLEAENKQLQNELREVRDENCRLYKLVSEKDFEIKQLQKRVQEERLALSGKYSHHAGLLDAEDKKMSLKIIVVVCGTQ